MSRFSLLRSVRALSATIVASALVACSDVPTSIPTDGSIIEPTSSFTLADRGAYSDVRIDPCGVTSETNRLFDALNLGTGAAVWVVAPGCYNVRVTTLGGTVRAMYGIYLSAGQTMDMASGALVHDPRDG